MIDLHCHILPGIDDGPQTLEDSMALAAAAARVGTRLIVATPHIDSRWNVDPLELGPLIETVRDQLQRENIALDVVGGGEVAADRLVSLTDAQVAAVLLGDGPYLLLESPHSAATGGFDTFAASLLARGRRIVLAHPERAPLFQRRSDLLERLVEAGALSSITAASLSGRFGGDVRDCALDMLERGLVHNVASDSHDAERRGPDLVEGIEAAERDLPGIAEMERWLTELVPEAIIAGRPLPRRPALPRRRGLRRWLRTKP